MLSLIIAGGLMVIISIVIPVLIRKVSKHWGEY